MHTLHQQLSLAVSTATDAVAATVNAPVVQDGGDPLRTLVRDTHKPQSDLQRVTTVLEAQINQQQQILTTTGSEASEANAFAVKQERRRWRIKAQSLNS